MNKLTAITLLTAGAIAFAPSPVYAGSKEKALIGGFIGGLILGHAIAESHESTCPPERGTVVVYDSRDRDCGYWKEVRVKVWVPGYWVNTHDRGHRSRYFVAGRHEWRINRVWVADSRHDRHDRHDRYDRYDRRDHRYTYNR
jgi:hypothetical protein